MTSDFNIDIDLLKNGDIPTYEAIYNEFFGTLFSLCYQYVSKVADAEEIVQDSFLKLWEIRTKLSDQTNIKNFLYTIAKNNCLNFIRNEQIASFHLTQYGEELKSNYEALSTLNDDFGKIEELKSRIDQAVDSLPERWKTVFRMSRDENLRYRDIAEKLSISEKTVEANITKALRRLKEDLQDYLTLVGVVINMII